MGPAVRTEQTYSEWSERFVQFCGGVFPEDHRKVGAYLEHLALVEGVAPATQAQALNALVFLYRHVMKQELLGRADISTTMIYTHVLNRPGVMARSPSDLVRPGLRAIHTHEWQVEQARDALGNFTYAGTYSHRYSLPLRSAPCLWSGVGAGSW